MLKDLDADGSPAGLLEMAADVVSAYVSNTTVRVSEVPELIRMVHDTLYNLRDGNAKAAEPEPEVLKAAISIRRSITPEYIVCLEDGKKLRMLKRYLRTNYGLSPEEYRARWNLPSSYPMVAPNYAKQRSEFAKQIGLGKGTSRRGRRKAVA